jgi:hypothetical protein
MTAGMMPILHFAGGDDAGAVGTDEAHRFVLEIVFHPHHVHDRNTLGDADNQGIFGVGRFHDGVGGKGRGHENHAGVGAGNFNGIGHRIENGNIVHLLAALSGGHAGHHLGAVITCMRGYGTGLLFQ